LNTWRKIGSWLLTVCFGIQAVLAFNGVLVVNNYLACEFLVCAIFWAIDFIKCFKKPLLPYLLYIITYDDGTTEGYIDLAMEPREHAAPDGKIIIAVDVKYFESDLDLETLNEAARKTNEIVNDQSCKN